MVHIMPGAVYRPIRRNFTNRKRARTRGIVNHVDAGNATTLVHWFNDTRASASSHLFVRRDGRIEQYMCLDVISWAQQDGNSDMLSVETQGYGNGTWTPQQVESLIKIWVYCANRYGFPIRAMKSSRRTENGIGWHAQGVPANRSQLQRRVSQTGGQLWSSAVGKICPGPDRIRQIPSMIKRAQAMAQPSPAPVPPQLKGSNMLMIALPKGRGSSTLYAVFSSGFWLEFTGSQAANTFIRQIGAIPAKALIVDQRFWNHCKNSATKGSNV